MTRARAALFLLAVTLAACSRDREDAPGMAASEATAPATRPPVDRLGALELAEGEEDAFGLRLPREVQVTRRFPTAIYASSTSATPDAVRAFVRARVAEGTVVDRDGIARFEGVRATRAPARLLRVEVRPGEVDSTSRVAILVQDVTPAAQPEGDPVERMRSVGLTPDGKLTDPSRLQ